jgi:hypothetical protein
MPISPGTYRLIAGAVSDQGLECDGERIPLVRENHDKVAAAVTAVRAKAESRMTSSPSIAAARKRLEALLDEAHVVAGQASERVELIVMHEDGSESLRRLARALREKTLVLK